MCDTVYMDQSEDCDQVVTQTQDLVEGDLFLVRSDVYGGKKSSQRQPAECSVTFNFGGRRLSIAVVEWTCEEHYREPMLAIYADCDVQQRSKPLVCSASTPCSEKSDIFVFFSIFLTVFFTNFMKLSNSGINVLQPMFLHEADTYRAHALKQYSELINSLQQ